jgi:hypothetical protein
MYEHDEEEFRNAVRPIYRTHPTTIYHPPQQVTYATPPPAPAYPYGPLSPYGTPSPYGSMLPFGGNLPYGTQFPGIPGPFGPHGPLGAFGPYGYPNPFQKMQTAKMLTTIGVIVDVLGQAIAAIMPVPGSPQIIGDQKTDDENMKRYQEALAGHAKTDERIRTAAKVVREALHVAKGF